MVEDFTILRLPEFVIADLYKNNLLLEEYKVQESVNPKFKFLGENKKFITIVHFDESNSFVDEQSLEMLGKLLNACKLSVADVAIVNIANQPITFKDCKEILLSQKLLMFGIESKQINLPLVFPSYKIQQYNNCQILMGSSLKRMQENNTETIAEKKQLWSLLKIMFDV